MFAMAESPNRWPVVNMKPTIGLNLERHEIQFCEAAAEYLIHTSL